MPNLTALTVIIRKNAKGAFEEIVPGTTFVATDEEAEELRSQNAVIDGPEDAAPTRKGKGAKGAESPDAANGGTDALV